MKNILELAEHLWGADGGLSLAQETLLRVAYGLPLSREQLAIWKEATGQADRALGFFRRPKYKPTEYRELSILSGRRSGKTGRCAVTVAIWEALFRPHKIPSGETFTVLCIAPGVRQANKQLFSLLKKKVLGSDVLREKLAGEPTSDELSFSNGVQVLVVPNNPRLLEGFTVCAAILDEVQNFKTGEFEANLPDVLDAVRPSLITVPGSKLVKIGRPGHKAGPMFKEWQERFENSRLLAWRLPSAVMNPSIERAELEAAKKRPEYFQAMYSGEFVEARNALLPPDLVDDAVLPGTTVIPPGSPALKVGRAFGAVDFATSTDDCAAAICAHTEIDGEDAYIITDVKLWQVKSGQLHAITDYLAEIGLWFSCYGVRKSAGDQSYLSVAESELKKHGVVHERMVTQGAGSEEMFDLLREVLRAKKLFIPDHPVLVSQLKALEERRERGYEVTGKGSKDDLATAVAAAVFKASQHRITRWQGPNRSWARLLSRLVCKEYLNPIVLMYHC